MNYLIIQNKEGDASSIKRLVDNKKIGERAF